MVSYRLTLPCLIASLSALFAETDANQFCPERPVADSTTFQFVTRLPGNVKQMSNCDWFDENQSAEIKAKRRRNRCIEEDIFNNCKKSCFGFKTWLPDNQTQMSTCDWFYENASAIDRRKQRWCHGATNDRGQVVAEYCADECGCFSDSNTNPGSEATVVPSSTPSRFLPSCPAERYDGSTFYVFYEEANAPLCFEIGIGLGKEIKFDRQRTEPDCNDKDFIGEFKTSDFQSFTDGIAGYNNGQISFRVDTDQQGVGARNVVIDGTEYFSASLVMNNCPDAKEPAPTEPTSDSPSISPSTVHSVSPSTGYSISPTSSPIPSSSFSPSTMTSSSPSKSKKVKKTKSPKGSKTCKKPKKANTVEVSVIFKGPEGYTKEEINELTCKTEKKGKKRVRRMTRSLESEVKILSGKVNSLSSDECIDDSCPYSAVGEAYYSGEGDENALTEALDTWLKSFSEYIQEPVVISVTLVEDDKDSKAAVTAGAELSDDQRSANLGTSFSAAASFVVVVGIALAFVIHRKRRRFNDLNSTMEEESLTSQQSGRDGHNSLRTKGLRFKSEAQYTGGTNDDGNVSFPVAANCLNTEFEVSSSQEI